MVEMMIQHNKHSSQYWIVSAGFPTKRLCRRGRPAAKPGKCK